MIVVIAEKPSVGRDIARVLGARNRGDGFLQGNGYVVTWAIGHLVHFAEPNEYSGNWGGRWSFHQLPMVPQNWKLKTHKNTLSQYKIVKKWINDPATTELICATDAGREGEHIFRLIYEFSKCRKPFRRLWVSSLTDEAIRAGLNNLKNGHDFDDLARAARARAQADWLVGLNLTRAYTVHHGALLTIGRVQTPTLAMLVRREEEITRFTKAFYYELVAHLNEGFSAKYLENEKTRIDSKTRADRLYRELSSNKTGVVTSVKQKKVRHRAPALYDLITLQKDANKRFGLTAAQVLEHAQKLYETYKLITYPRTESRHISEDMVPQLPGILAKLEHPQAPEALARLKNGLKLSRAYVDKTRLSDHHGILPTGKRPPANLVGPTRQIYDLVVARFVAIFLPDHEVENTTILLDIGGATFQAKGAEVLVMGWKVVEPRKGPVQKGADGKWEQLKKLPDVKKGQTVHIDKMELLEKETTPPKRYTDATLLSAMKNAGREVEDDELAEAMKDSGLGTPATRAEIIEKLIRTGLAQRRKKVLSPTGKGMSLIGAVSGPLRSPELTGSWEQKLKRVEQGRHDVGDFYQSIVAFIGSLIQEVQRSPILAVRDETPQNRSGHRPDPKPAADSKKKPAPAKGDAKPKDDRAISEAGGCPACGQGTIIEGNQAYGCTRYRQGCRFLIPKELSGKKLTKKQAGDLVTRRKTTKLKGFKSEDGKSFSAILRLDDQLSIKVERQEEKADAPLNCPKCGQGRIIQGKKGYGCSRYKQGCRFVVWQEISGKKLSAKQIERLVRKGRSTLIKGFKSKNGNKFEAYLKLDEAFAVRFEFPERSS